MKYTFIVPGIPVAQHRKRITTAGKFARVYTVEADVVFRKIVQTAFYKFKDKLAIEKGYSPFPIARPNALIVSLTFMMPIPESYSQKKREAALLQRVRPITKPDNDNLEKAIFDGLNTHAWHDDSQIVRNVTDKVYHSVPMTVVEIEIWGWSK